MISAEIILDDRRETKKGYPIKIRIYDSLVKKHSPHKYIALKMYQPGPAIKYSSILKRRSLELDKEVEYCNSNFLGLNDSYNIILNGIPTDDLENEIILLELKLKQLYEKRIRKFEKGFVSFIDDLIIERVVQGKDIKAYHSIKNIILGLLTPEIDIPINSLTKEFVKSMELTLRERGVKSNSIKTYFTLMKVVLDESKTRESLNIKNINPFYEIKVFDKEKVEYDLRVDDLIKIKDLDIESINTKGLITTTKFDLKRDSEIFLFQFSIGGHDLIDIANLKWSNIKKGRLVFKRTKNRNKTSSTEVDVRLSDYAKYVIGKYGDKENERVFSYLPNPNTDHLSYTKHVFMLNRVRYKRITQSIDLGVELKTKAPRYIFRTIAGNLLLNDFVIMKIQGHKPQGITFGYQGALNHEIQDIEHQKVLDLVF